MRKRLLTVLVAASILILTACSSKEPRYANERTYTMLPEMDYNLDDYDLTNSEKEFVETFKDYYESYRIYGPGCEYDYGIIHDKYYELYQNDKSIEDSAVINNLYAFCEANKDYSAQISDWDIMGDGQASKIDFSYTGPYATEVITFAEDMIGKPVELLTDEEEQANYDALTMDDKVRILNTMSECKNKDRESELERLSKWYRISKEHISQIIADSEVIIEAGKKAAQKDSTSKEEVVDKSPTRARDAWVCAQDVVSSELKSPSTAKYCTYPEATVTKQGSTYTIKGYVDAQNGYDTTIRQNFTVTLELTTNGYKNGSVTFN